VAVMIVALSLVNGFQQVISHKIFDFWGHLIVAPHTAEAGVFSEEKHFDYNPDLEAALKADPAVQSVYLFNSRFAIVRNAQGLDGILLRGVDWSFETSGFRQFLQQADEDLGYTDTAMSRKVILSQYTANRLQLKYGDSIVVFFIQNSEAMPRAAKVRIAGIYKTGLEDYDKLFAICDYRLVNHYSGLPENSINGYTVNLKHPNKAESEKHRLYQKYVDPPLTVKTISEVYPNLFDWLRLQNMNERIILIIMVVVALINMASAIMILILERTNMIGVLKAMGMRNGQIQRIFWMQSLYILMRGLLYGNIIGLGLALIQQYTSVVKLPEETYYIPAAPIAIPWLGVLLVNVGTIILCGLVMLLPALIIRRITPLKAIRFD
jgi:lipoprotein-releasing system permease protein